MLLDDALTLAEYPKKRSEATYTFNEENIRSEDYISIDSGYVAMLCTREQSGFLYRYIYLDHQLEYEKEIVLNDLVEGERIHQMSVDYKEQLHYKVLLLDESQQGLVLLRKGSSDNLEINTVEFTFLKETADAFNQYLEKLGQNYLVKIHAYLGVKNQIVHQEYMLASVR